MSCARAVSRLAVLVALVVTTATAHAQEAAPHEVATRVHEEGGYATDVHVSPPEDGAEPGAGAGRGPRGETSIDGDRETSEPRSDVPLPAWLRDALDWLGRALSGLAGPLGYTFLALGLAGIVLLVAFFAASIRFRTPRFEARARRDGASDAAIDPFLVGSGESADALAAQGRWREAIHALFLDSLKRVGGAEGRLRSRTARELVRAVDPARAGRAELEELLDLAELLWFGGRDADERQYHEARALADAVASAGVVGGADAEEHEPA